MPKRSQRSRKQTAPLKGGGQRLDLILQWIRELLDMSRGGAREDPRPRQVALLQQRILATHQLHQQAIAARAALNRQLREANQELTRLMDEVYRLDSMHRDNAHLERPVQDIQRLIAATTRRLRNKEREIERLAELYAELVDEFNVLNH